MLVLRERVRVHSTASRLGRLRRDRSEAARSRPPTGRGGVGDQGFASDDSPPRRPPRLPLHRRCDRPILRSRGLPHPAVGPSAPRSDRRGVLRAPGATSIPEAGPDDSGARSPGERPSPTASQTPVADGARRRCGHPSRNPRKVPANALSAAHRRSKSGHDTSGRDSRIDRRRQHRMPNARRSPNTPGVRSRMGHRGRLTDRRQDERRIDRRSRMGSVTESRTDRRSRTAQRQGRPDQTAAAGRAAPGQAGLARRSNGTPASSRHNRPDRPPRPTAVRRAAARARHLRRRSGCAAGERSAQSRRRSRPGFDTSRHRNRRRPVAVSGDGGGGPGRSGLSPPG